MRTIAPAVLLLGLTGLVSAQSSSGPGNTINPIFVAGTVATDDQSPLPLPITIELVCGGSIRPVTRVDPKGSWGFSLGGTNLSANADATTGRATTPTVRGGASATGAFGPSSTNAGGGVSENYVWSCEVRAVADGYRSSKVPLAGIRYLDEKATAGVIMLYRMGKYEGLTTSATTTAAPKEAQKAYTKGVEAFKKANIDESQKSFQKAVELYPQYAVAWCDLGKVYEMRDHFGDARKAYEKALEADPKYASPYERLYLVAAREGKWQEVADYSGKLLRLNPYDFPAAYYYNASANGQLNNLDAAEKSAREGLKTDAAVKFPRLHYILGLILAQKGDAVAASESIRQYIAAAPAADDLNAARAQLEALEKQSKK
jgi:hypothetical protein